MGGGLVRRPAARRLDFIGFPSWHSPYVPSQGSLDLTGLSWLFPPLKSWFFLLEVCRCIFAATDGAITNPKSGHAAWMLRRLGADGQQMAFSAGWFHPFSYSAHSNCTIYTPKIDVGTQTVCALARPTELFQHKVLRCICRGCPSFSSPCVVRNPSSEPRVAFSRFGATWKALWNSSRTCHCIRRSSRMSCTDSQSRHLRELRIVNLRS